MSAPLEPLTLEDRVAALEKEVAKLQVQLERLTKPPENWLERISGSMSDLPAEVWAEYQKVMEDLDRADRAASGVPD